MNQESRICIVGGGPAGLSAAMYLEKKGYHNYVIYEKLDRVGGKCYSPEHEGKRYEMGAIMGVPSYYAVHDVEEFCGITHDGPQLNRNYKTLDGKTYDPFDPKSNIFKLPYLLRTKKQVKKIGLLLETKYKGYDINGHRGIASGKYDGYAVTPGREPVKGENPNLKDLALPFDEFCRINGVSNIRDVWIGPFTAFGYGYFDEIPAAYVLKYLDFQTTMNFVKCNLWTWKNGTQSIWEALNAKLMHQAVLNSNITKVVRTNENVLVTVNGKDEVFDHIIVTAPLQYMCEYFDITESEKKLFSKIDYERYDVLATRPKKGCYPDISYYMFDNMTKERLGHLMVYYRRWKDETNQVITTYALRKHKDMKEIPYDDCKKMVIEDMKICGAQVDTIDKEQSWYYFPHIDSETYQTGWYDQVEAMQGSKHTYYAGEIMAFGDMDETAEYSRELVERFF